MVSADLASWLLDSDPALRWQVERDLLREPETVWRATRRRVASEGMGARLLALQGDDGQWADGSYFPKPGADAAAEVVEDGQPWTATTWSLNALRAWGVAADALTDPMFGPTADRLAAHSRWDYDDLPYWGGEVDCCINGYTLANGTWLGVDVSVLDAWFVAHQMAEGGWNCEWENGSTRASFPSTLNALTGILEREEAGLASAALRDARKAGEEYLLRRALFRRLSTGEPYEAAALRFAHPYRWTYDVLRAADYFRRASVLDEIPPDPRLADAVGIIRDARQPDGTWLQQRHVAGTAWFAEDVPVGEASPWLTLVGTRVLDWWDAH